MSDRACSSLSLILPARLVTLSLSSGKSNDVLDVRMTHSENIYDAPFFHDSPCNLPRLLFLLSLFSTFLHRSSFPASCQFSEWEVHHRRACLFADVLPVVQALVDFGVCNTWEVRLEKIT